MIAAADGVDRILAGRVVAQLGCRTLRVHGDRGARQRRSPERRAGGAPVPVDHPVHIPRECLSVRQQQVGEDDRLGGLQMREPRRQRIDMPGRLRGQRVLQRQQGADDVACHAIAGTDRRLLAA